MQNILFIEELCASAGMDQYSNKGFCFKANGTVYLGGKKEGNEPTKFDDKEICVSDLTSLAFWKDVAKNILEFVFPDIGEIWRTSKDIKDAAFAQTRKEKRLAKTRGKADQDAKKFDSYTEDDAAKEEDKLPPNTVTRPYREKFDKLMSEFEDDYVVRDDEVVAAFRDIYDDDDDAEDDVVEDKSGADVTSGIQFDPASLTNTSGVHICRRTTDLVNVYSGAAESFNYLLSAGEQAKKGFEDHLGAQATRFVGMEADIRNRSVAEGLDEDEENDHMFFVNKAKQGIAKRKTSLTQKYEVIDKSNLQTWRTYVGEVTSQKQMDVASFLDALSTASKETAKRMEVPNKKFDKTLSSAEKIMRGLLSNDDATLSSKKSAVEKLVKAANAIREVAKEHKCFENGLTE